MADETPDLNPFDWKKAAAQWALQYGFPGVFALILLAALLGWLDNPLTRSVELLDAQGKALQEHIINSAERANQQTALVSEQTMILRQMCVQQAKTDNDRMRCLGAK